MHVPAPVGPLIGFVLGAAFAWAASDELARSGSSSLLGRSLAVVALFTLLVYGPVCAYFLAFAPDWSFAYLIDSERFAGALDLVLLLADLASVPAGYLAAAKSARAHRLGAVVRIALLPALLAVLFVAATLPRLTVNATYAQYHGDFGIRSESGSALGYGLLWMLTVLAGGIIWTLRSLRRIGQNQ